MKHVCTLLVLLICFGCSKSEVDTFGGISGTVADEVTREPLAGVKVALTPSGTSQVTGTDGNFLFDNLDPQEYTLTFTKDDYISQSQKVSVKAGTASSVQVSMEPIVPILKVTPVKLDFGQEATTLALDITNSGKGALQWSINEEIAWLYCSPASGTTNKESSSVVVTVSRAEMERGNYNGTLVVSSNGGSQGIPVSMSVESINLEVTPTEADFGSLTNSLRLTLKNTGSGTLKYTAESSNKWLVLSKESGSVTQTDFVEAIVSREGLSPGKYNATITFSVADGDVVIPVKMEVAVDEKPTVSVENATDITYNSVILHGTMVSVGSSKVTKYGFCWSEQPAPTIESAYSNLGDCTAPMAFESVANDLKSDTKYYFRAYAQNSVGIVYSEKTLSFTTSGLPTLPVVSSGAVSEITSASAKAKGNVTSLGNVSKVMAYGHVWSKTAEPTLQTGKYTNLGEATETKAFTSEITGLKAHTIYYVRAYATNEKGTAYGDDISFTTSKTDVRLTTSDVTEIVHNAATGGGTVADDGGHTVMERGVCWDTKTAPTIEDNHATTVKTASPGVSSLASSKAAESRTEYVTRAGNSFSCRITGLTKKTRYYVRAYVKTSDGTVFYGDEKQFTTTEEVLLPTLSEITVSNIQTTSVTAISKIESDGNGTITECGFCYSKNAAPTVDTGTKVACDPASAELGKNITGLTDGTTYHIRAYAKNAMGVAYSKEAEFTTLEITVPKLSAVAVENVGRTTAYASATIAETGNATVTECGFCWATNPYPTVYDNKVSCEVGTSFKAKLQELPLLTTVYVRAYATNAKGTGYSDDASFTTTDTDIDIWDGVSVATKFGGGMGTQSDPIIINSADQLKLLANNVNSGKSTYNGIYFRLDVNIGLGNHPWTPIGTSNNKFLGTLDGNNKTIDGLYIYTSSSNQGLFAFNDGVIKNLLVKGAITAANYVGGICGSNNNIIDNCINGVTITATGENIGGLAGYLDAMKATIRGCKNLARISGASTVGGICGYIIMDLQSMSSKTVGAIYNCQNEGQVFATAIGSEVGGIIGHIYVDGEQGGKPYYTQYLSTCRLSNLNNLGNITGANSQVGGIIGCITIGKDGPGIVEIVNSNSNAEKSVKGGLVGAVKIDWWDTAKCGISAIKSYWLFDIANNIGIEAGVGSGASISASWYNHNSSGCYLKGSNEDIVTLLNNWVSSNSGTTAYRRWKYETIDGYACPVFED